MRNVPLEFGRLFPPKLVDGNRAFRRQKLKVRRKDGTTMTKPSMQKRAADRRRRENS